MCVYYMYILYTRMCIYIYIYVEDISIYNFNICAHIPMRVNLLDYRSWAS